MPDYIVTPPTAITTVYIEAQKMGEGTQNFLVPPSVRHCLGPSVKNIKNKAPPTTCFPTYQELDQ